MTPLYKREVRMLPARYDCVQQIEGDWIVAKVIPNHEKLVVSALVAADEPFFFPFTTRTRHYEKRDVVIELPMMQGYVFITTPSARELLNSELISRHMQARAHRYIPVPTKDRPRFVNDLANFQIMADAAKLDPNAAVNTILHPLRTKGTRVNVVAGPYIGLSGLVVGYDGPNARVQVSVILLGVAVDVPIPEDFLERV